MPVPMAILEDYGDYYKTMIEFEQSGYIRIVEYKSWVGAGDRKFCVFLGQDGDPIDLTLGELETVRMLVDAVLKDSATRTSIYQERE